MANEKTRTDRLDSFIDENHQPSPGQAIGDSAQTGTEQIDLNGASTAVGVHHPENRQKRPEVDLLELPDFELDDYDDDKQREPLIDSLPPNQDAGESFQNIVDIGEGSEPAPAHQPRIVNLTGEMANSSAMQPTVDNQENQPERFHNTEGDIRRK